MKTTLSPDQRDELRQSFSQQGFTADGAIAKLVSQGYDETAAKQLIVAEFRSYKKDLFDKAVKHDENNEAQKFIPIVVVMVSIIGPVFEITSILWYIVAVAVAGAAGYWGFKLKPLAGLLGSIIFPIVFPFVYEFYFTGRTSYIKIEMAIPLIMAAVPALIVYYIVSKAMYSNAEEY